ncbi:MAG: peptide-methionine (S)-S-oxide reductase [Planctomycetes bacterium]|nr:peptide-methionine (S)-S-oxide reductase [Planctomycetota bacterium]
MPGVVRTRVGYTGGTLPNPTYRRLGDHTEAIQIDFDPRVVSYRDLLAVFFSSHNPCARPYSRQYMSAVFTHSAKQAELAWAAAATAREHLAAAVRTRIEPLGTFTRAEDYHQKYTLRQYREVVGELLALYPNARDFTDSTAAARLNGYLAGSGAAADFARDLPRLGLSDRARQRVAAVCGGRLTAVR